jgi:hypothetical protein
MLKVHPFCIHKISKSDEKRANLHPNDRVFTLIGGKIICAIQQKKNAGMGDVLSLE